MICIGTDAPRRGLASQGRHLGGNGASSSWITAGTSACRLLRLIGPLTSLSVPLCDSENSQEGRKEVDRGSEDRQDVEQWGENGSEVGLFMELRGHSTNDQRRQRRHPLIQSPGRSCACVQRALLHTWIIVILLRSTSRAQRAARLRTCTGTIISLSLTIACISRFEARGTQARSCKTRETHGEFRRVAGWRATFLLILAALPWEAYYRTQHSGTVASDIHTECTSVHS